MLVKNKLISKSPNSFIGASLDTRHLSMYFTQSKTEKCMSYSSRKEYDSDLLDELWRKLKDIEKGLK